MSNVLPHPRAEMRTGLGHPEPVYFNRLELDTILQVYGRMVAAGEWRDYSIEATSEWASFSAYKRASDMPDYRIIKEPELARKQGAYRLVSASGQILKRGNELALVLKLLNAKLLKLMAD